MNKIKAKLVSIKSIDNLNLLEFEKKGQTIKVLILQMNINLKIGDEALLYVKPTKLFLNNDKCNFENVLEVTVKHINKGKILASIICEFEEEIEVLMLKEYVNFHNKAYLFFKSSDISVIGKI